MPRQDRRADRPNLPWVDEDGQPYPPIKHDDLPADIVLARLRGVVLRGPGGWIACCPAHADRRPSLSLTETDERKLLVHCHAGCDPASVMEAIGLTTAFLFPTPHAQRCAGPGRPRPAGKPRHAHFDVENIDTQVFDDLARDYTRSPGAADRVKELAAELGVDAGVLHRLGVGWDDRNGRWSVPERHNAGGVVGIAYRSAADKKICYSGSTRALIFPGDLANYTGPIYVPEGMSDTAALLTFGCAAVGRPMATTPTNVAYWLPLLLARHGGGIHREVIVVGDRRRPETGRATERLARLRPRRHRAGFRKVAPGTRPPGAVGPATLAPQRRPGAVPRLRRPDPHHSGGLT